MVMVPGTHPNTLGVRVLLGGILGAKQLEDGLYVTAGHRLRGAGENRLGKVARLLI